MKYKCKKCDALELFGSELSPEQFVLRPDAKVVMEQKRKEYFEEID